MYYLAALKVMPSSGGKKYFMVLKFNRKSQSGFFAEVKKEVGDYFNSNNISRNANAAMVLKTILFLGGLPVLYYLIVFGQFSLGATFG